MGASKSTSYFLWASGNKRRRGIFALLLALSFLILFSGMPCFAGKKGPSARGIFALLPPSIFENTPEGLSERAKQELLATGRSEFWELQAETVDMLIFAELPFGDRSVALRLFRNEKDGSIEIALGTLGEEICSLELWRMDASGRLVPVDAPDEPKFGEFFAKKRPKTNGQTVLLCLSPRGLEAKPILWSKRGSSLVRPDYDINFIWDGTRFRKEKLPKKSFTQKPHPDTSSIQNRK